MLNSSSFSCGDNAVNVTHIRVNDAHLILKVTRSKVLPTDLVLSSTVSVCYRSHEECVHICLTAAKNI